jgi:hypothetical protein
VAAPAQAAGATITGVTPDVVVVGLSDVTKTWSLQTTGAVLRGGGVALAAKLNGLDDEDITSAGVFDARTVIEGRQPVEQHGR